MSGTPVDPLKMVRPRRQITGISATLLPYTASLEIDWDGFCAHLARTASVGLTPAVNMDTGYVSLLDEAMRRTVLARTQETLAGKPFVAGAFVADRPGDPWRQDEYRRQTDLIQHYGGMPVIFQSYGLTDQASGEVLAAYSTLGRDCPQFIAFELGQMFAPFGQIYDLNTYAGLMDISQCIGAKHSSLNRQLEWQRLALRDRRRPDFGLLSP